MTSPEVVREALEVTQADIDQAAAYLGNPPDMAEPEEAELVQILATHRRSAIAGSAEAVAGCLAAAYAAGRSSVRLKSGNPGMNVWRKNALAALDAMPGEGWQDIATAPKDGTKFDAWVPDAFGGHRMTDLSFGWRGKLRQHGTLTEAELPRWPTHWRPVPAAPLSGSVVK